MPNRVIREGLVDSRKVASLSDFAYRVYTSLFVCVDDAGRLRAAPELVKAKALPLSQRPLEDIAQALSEIESAGLIYIYEFDSEQYLQVLKWQCLGRSKHSRCPFDDGSFDIEHAKLKTRDGDKLFVSTSLTRKRSHVLQRPHPDPIPTPSSSQSDFADTREEGREKGEEGSGKESAATAARAGVGCVPSKYTPDFEEAFDAYRPTARGGKSKQQAFAAWWHAIAKLRKDEPAIEPVPWLLSQIKSYVASDEGRGEYAPLMSSWLNAGKWEDDPAKWSGDRRAGPVVNGRSVSGNQAVAERLKDRINAELRMASGSAGSVPRLPMPADE